MILSLSNENSDELKQEFMENGNLRFFENKPGGWN